MLCLLFKHSLKQSILIDPLFRKFYLTFFRYSADTGENGNRVSDRAGCAESAPVGGHVRHPFSPVGKASGSFLLLYLNFYIPYDGDALFRDGVFRISCRSPNTFFVGFSCEHLNCFMLHN